MPQPRKALSLEEVDSLIGAGASLFERAIPTILFSTGALPSELVTFRLLDIEWKLPGSRSGYISVKADLEPERIFILNQKALGAIRDYIHERPSQKGWLFEKEDGSPYAAEEILEVLNRLAERVEFEKFEGTTLRDTMAVQLLERGADPDIVDAIVGPSPLGPAVQLARLKATHEQGHLDPVAQPTRREQDLDMLAAEKIYAALAKKAGQ